MTDQQDLRALVERIDQCFRSGNSVPIEKAWIRREDWAALREAADQLGRVGDVPFATVERVCNALIRMGCSVPESKEEQAARSMELVDWLCEEVLTRRPQLPAGVPDAIHEKDAPGIWKKHSLAYAAGWNQCREAMLTTPQPDSAAPGGDVETDRSKAFNTILWIKENHGWITDDCYETLRQALFPPAPGGDVEQSGCRYTTDAGGNGYILRDGVKMSADEIIAALSAPKQVGASAIWNPITDSKPVRGKIGPYLVADADGDYACITQGRGTDGTFYEQFSSKLISFTPSRFIRLDDILGSAVSPSPQAAPVPEHAEYVVIAGSTPFLGLNQNGTPRYGTAVPTHSASINGPDSQGGYYISIGGNWFYGKPHKMLSMNEFVKAAPVPVDRSAWRLHDRIEFALRDGGFTEAEAAAMTARIEARVPVEGDGWIACADRMPEEGRLVVAYIPDGGDGGNFTFEFWQDDCWQRHAEDYDHFISVGGSGAAGPDCVCIGPGQDAPYTFWRYVDPPGNTPSQPAVELEQFRRAISWASLHAVTPEFGDYCKGLLALIDVAKENNL